MAVLNELREAVLKANLALVRHGLVTLTWGNASGIDRAAGLVVIKPSGVPYEEMGVEDLVVVDLAGRGRRGRTAALDRRPDPSPPLPLFPRDRRSRPHPLHLGDRVGAGRAGDTDLRDDPRRPVPRPVPIARRLSDDEVRPAPTRRTRGSSCVEVIGDRGIDEVPCALVPGHGPFTWGAERRAGGRAGRHARSGRTHGPPHPGRPSGAPTRSRRSSSIATSRGSTDPAPTTANPAERSPERPGRPVRAGRPKPTGAGISRRRGPVRRSRRGAGPRDGRRHRAPGAAGRTASIASSSRPWPSRKSSTV